MSVASRTEWAVVAAFALFALVNALCWAVVTPLGDAPDEPGHFEVVAFEAAFGEIPEFGVDDYGTTRRIAIDGYPSPLNTYSAQPGISYIVSAGAIRLLGDRLDEPARAARFPGALWAAMMTIVVFAGVRAMFPDEADAAVLAALVAALWPQLAFLFSYINNDGLTTVACAGLVATWFVGRNRGWRAPEAAALGIASGLVLLNKPNGFPLVLVGGLLFLAGLEGSLRSRGLRVVVAAAAGLATCGWWYLIAFRRYGWDLLASGRAERLRDELGVQWASGQFYGKSLLETAFDPFPRFGETWIEGTFRTAVGVLGELTIPLPEWAYVIVGAITIASILGFAVSLFKQEAWRSRLSLMHVAAFLLLPAFLGLSLFRSWAHDFQAQGRYLFPAMLPFLGFLAVGVLQPFRGRWRGVAGALVTLAFVFVLVDSFLIRLLGAYRMTFSDLWNRTPVLAALWVASLLVALGAASLYWLRVGGGPEWGGSQDATG
jgi:4-amino-4-deoxy-L-arabinose transferase-like glycosyltransferase